MRPVAWTTALALAVAPATAYANGRFPSAEQLVVDPGDPSHIVVQTTYGFIQTVDAGGSWHWICEDAAAYGGILDPPVAILDGGTLIAGVFDGLAVSTPDACHFELVPGPLASRFFTDVSATKLDPRRAIAISSNGLGMNQFDTRLWRTDDAGVTWAQAGASLPGDFLGLTTDAAPSDASRIYLSGFVVGSGSDYSGAIARSVDGGASWEVLPIPGSGNKSGPYLAAIDPTDPDTLYVRLASEIGTLHVSHDAGDTWEPIFTASSMLLGFALSPDGSQIRVGSETDGVLGASTGDMVFAPLNPTPTRCLTWAADGLYVCAKEALAGFTIGRSTDGGATFQAIHHLHCLDGPDPACAPGSSVEAECTSRWAAQKQLLLTELCETPPAPAEPAPTLPPEDDACGCAAPGMNHARFAPGVLLLVLGVFLLRTTLAAYTRARRLARRASHNTQAATSGHAAGSRGGK